MSSSSVQKTTPVASMEDMPGSRSKLMKRELSRL